MKRAEAGFAPTHYNLAMFLMRVSFGVLLFAKHGLEKLMNFSKTSQHFPDPLHIGPAASLSLSILAEVLCSLLVVLGFATRAAAAIITVNLAVAFVVVHHFRLLGQGNGELALLYLAGFLVVIVAGPGSWSIDASRR